MRHSLGEGRHILFRKYFRIRQYQLLKIVENISKNAITRLELIFDCFLTLIVSGCVAIIVSWPIMYIRHHFAPDLVESTIAFLNFLKLSIDCNMLHPGKCCGTRFEMRLFAHVTSNTITDNTMAIVSIVISLS